jgi:probable rRNA maturation factor
MKPTSMGAKTGGNPRGGPVRTAGTGSTSRVAPPSPLPDADLSLSMQFADPAPRAWLPRHRVRRWLRAALVRPAQMTVRWVGSEEGRALNRDFRSRDYATNVLTFDYAHEPVVTADLVICVPVVAEEARTQGLDLLAHHVHLLLHGALHAQGWDHENAADARRMEARESELMQQLGFADPYRLR